MVNYGIPVRETNNTDISLNPVAKLKIIKMNLNINNIL